MLCVRAEPLALARNNSRTFAFRSLRIGVSCDLIKCTGEGKAYRLFRRRNSRHHNLLLHPNPLHRLDHRVQVAQRSRRSRRVLDRGRAARAGRAHHAGGFFAIPRHGVPALAGAALDLEERQ